jgi:hypothetical protein
MQLKREMVGAAVLGTLLLAGLVHSQTRLGLPQLPTLPVATTTAGPCLYYEILPGPGATPAQPTVGCAALPAGASINTSSTPPVLVLPAQAAAQLWNGPEIPQGAINGANASFALTAAPNPPAALFLFRNGLLQEASVDYTLSAKAVTFLSASVPQTGDTLLALYRTQ